MKYVTSKQFQKSFSKLPKKVKEKAIKQLELFLVDPANINLNNHPLNGKWSSYRSININSDIRAIYKIEDEKLVRFVDIGSHAKLYK